MPEPTYVKVKTLFDGWIVGIKTFGNCNNVTILLPNGKEVSHGAGFVKYATKEEYDEFATEQIAEADVEEE